MPEAHEGPEPHVDGLSATTLAEAGVHVVRLRPRAWRLYQALEHLQGEGEFCVATRDELASTVEALGHERPSDRTLGYAANELRSAGLVHSTGRPGRAQTWFLMASAPSGVPFAVLPYEQPSPGREIVRSAGSRTSARAAQMAENLSIPNGSHAGNEPVADGNLVGKVSTPPIAQTAGEPVAADPLSIVDRQSSSGVAAAAAAGVEPAHAAAQFAAGNGGNTDVADMSDPLFEAVAARLVEVGQDPAPGVVAELLTLTAEQTAFVWHQMALYPPRSSSPRYTLALIESARRLHPASPPPPPASCSSPSSEVAKPEAAPAAVTVVTWTAQLRFVAAVVGALLRRAR